MRASVALALLVLIATVLPTAQAAPARVTLEAPERVIAGETVTFHGAVREPLLYLWLYLPSRAVEIRDGEALVASGTTDIWGEFTAKGRLSPGARDLVAVSSPGTSSEGRSGLVRVVSISPPGAPSLSVAQRYQSWRAADVAWTLPTLDGGDSPDALSLERRIGTGAWTMVASLPAEAGSQTESVLPSTAYEYRMRAHNDAGWGPFATARLVTEATPPADLVTIQLGVTGVCGSPCNGVASNGDGWAYTPVEDARLSLWGGVFARAESLPGSPVAVRVETLASGPCARVDAVWQCPASGAPPTVFEWSGTTGSTGVYNLDPELGMGAVDANTTVRWSFAATARSGALAWSTEKSIFVSAFVWDGSGDPPCSDGCGGGSD